MIRRPPRSTQSRSSAASDVYKRQELQIKSSIQFDPHIVDVFVKVFSGNIKVGSEIA